VESGKLLKACNDGISCLSSDESLEPSIYSQDQLFRKNGRNFDLGPVTFQ
jgi:hypothetical protein